MALRSIASDLSIGPVRTRIEIIPIAIGVALFAGVEHAVGFLAAVFVHELGHFFAARALGLHPEKVVLQLTGGGTYVREVLHPRTKILVLLAGPLASLLLVFASFTLWSTVLHTTWALAVAYASTVWFVYQFAPFPPLDGGQTLRTVLAGRLPSATIVWWLGWGLGLLIAIGLVALDPRSVQLVVLLTGAAVVLGRAESGYVRHLDAYEAWEKGDHARVVELVRKTPDFLEKEDKARLLELGVHAAMELGDEGALEALTADLPAHRPVVVAAAEWLLVRGKSWGAKLAERALDALDQEVARPGPEERERFADLAFRYAIFEVRELRAESGLGLLERALDLGFRDADRLEADAHLAPLAPHPRFQRLLSRLRA